jgi:hypothetical protein
MIIGQNFTRRRKGAKKTEDEYIVATATSDFLSSRSKTSLRLRAFA